MPNNENKDSIKKDYVEDATQYGEFISTFHKWMTLDKQREIVDKLENATEKDENQRN